MGNANNELVNDRNFAARTPPCDLWKTWMGTYHEILASKGVTDIAQSFDNLRPANVAQREFDSPTTDRQYGPDFKFCDQKVTAWIRTDVKYDSQCEEKEIDTRNGFLATAETPAQFKEMKKFVKLPDFKPEPAEELAKDRGIPSPRTTRARGRSRFRSPTFRTVARSALRSR